jgi:hypothetical protein
MRNGNHVPPEARTQGERANQWTPETVPFCVGGARSTVLSQRGLALWSTSALVAGTSGRTPALGQAS